MAPRLDDLLERGVITEEEHARQRALDDDPRNRTDFGLMIMRFMACAEDWENSPTKATTPGTEAEVMGPYYPRG